MVVVLDRGEKDKPAPAVEPADAAIQKAAADVLSNGEVTGKNFETTLLHNPGGLKAKRLLLLGGGKAKSFSAYELRRLAGAAARTLKSRGLRSFAFLAPQTGLDAVTAAKSIVEGVFVGNFEPDYYKSDRKDQKIDEVSVVSSGDQAKLQAAVDHGRITSTLARRKRMTLQLVPYG